MAEDATYTEHRAEIAGLRKRPDGALRSGNFQYPSFPFRTPQELLENRVGHQQIVIVGGGLAGLTAAVDFGVRRIACVLLDDNNTVSLGSRSIAQGKRTMDIATRLGIAERMLPKGISWSKGNTLIQDKLLYSFDLSPEGEEKYQAFLCLPQYYVKSMLVERAGEFPHVVDLRWSSRVVGIAQDGDRVRLDVETPEGHYALTADWVIACDGVRSAVRRLLGVPFEGDKYVENFVICDVKMVFNFPPQRMFWFDPTFDKSNISLMHQQPDSIGGLTGSSAPTTIRLRNPSLRRSTSGWRPCSARTCHLRRSSPASIHSKSGGFRIFASDAFCLPATPRTSSRHLAADAAEIRQSRMSTIWCGSSRTWFKARRAHV